jgi:branched-chain amino acid transport system substrate-binding protein
MMIIRRTAGVVGTVAMVAAMLAGCGSRQADQRTSSTGPASTPATTTVTSTGSPVRIGLVGTLSGPIGATVVPVRDGVQAWVESVNARGGVNGHPVELIIADDQADSARHRALVQELVEERGVVAFVGNTDGLTGAGSLDYLEEREIPVIGGDLGATWSYESPVLFPQASSGRALVQAAIAGIATQAAEAGHEEVAFVACAEVQVCRDAAAAASAQATDYGVNLVYAAEVSLFQPDFTAECISARDAGADVMGVVMDGNGISRLAQSCARQDYHPVFAFTSTVILPEHQSDPELQGALIPVNVAPWFAETPAVEEYREALATFMPDVEPSAGSMIGWVAGKLFERATSALPEPPTSGAVLDGLHDIVDDDLDGLTQPLTFRRGEPADPIVCWFNVSIVDGAFASPDGGERHCEEFRP